MSFNINNRRYTGSKYKIVPWIRQLIIDNCKDSKSFCDLFAGTGVVTNGMINDFDEFIINDFLYSNEIIYNAFFLKENFSEELLFKYYKKYKNLLVDNLKENYVSKNYGNRFFSIEDAIKIGYIREEIESDKDKFNKREYSILLSSLIYSFDRIANTVGHYDAFIKNKTIRSSFQFELINPVIESSSDYREIAIMREDANILASKINSDIVYIDPPYSSRQYSRFYHVIENIVKWDKPKLYGVAVKPEPENMSKYSSSKAIDSFRELISDLNSKYIVVSYNNTYNSKSKSSQNKMSLEDISTILNRKGLTKIYTTEHQAFNAGKTEFKDHKEFLFITRVGAFNE